MLINYKIEQFNKKLAQSNLFRLQLTRKLMGGGGGLLKRNLREMIGN